jgi:hypothetical protein
MKTFKERLKEEIEGKKQMDEAEAIIYLIWYNQWRIGAVDEMPTAETLTEAIETIIQAYYKKNKSINI